MNTAAAQYYIADVHGMAGLLEKLLSWIEADARSRGREPTAAFLGDLVDRGPESRRVVDLAIATLDGWPGSAMHLGNHDEWFLDMLIMDGKAPEADSWLLHGGIRTIQSYLGETWDGDAMRRIVESHPGHVSFLKSARLHSFNGPFLAVHAGVDPTLPVEDWTRNDLLWIRDPFLRYVGTDVGPVIHGHTIVGSLPVVTENRLSLDTGAYSTGRLTCLAIDPERQDARFVQATPEGVTEVEPVLVDRGLGTVLDRLPALFARGGDASRPVPPPPPAAYRRGR